MGSLGPHLRADVADVSLAEEAEEAAVANYHAGLRERVRRVLEAAATTTTTAATTAASIPALDMAAVNAHLRKRHAAYEMRQQLRHQAVRYEMLYRRALAAGGGLRHAVEEQRCRDRRQALELCYRGVDLHYRPAVAAASR